MDGEGDGFGPAAGVIGFVLLGFFRVLLLGGLVVGFLFVRLLGVGFLFRVGRLLVLLLFGLLFVCLLFFRLDFFGGNQVALAEGDGGVVKLIGAGIVGGEVEDAVVWAPGEAAGAAVAGGDAAGGEVLVGAADEDLASGDDGDGLAVGAEGLFADLAANVEALGCRDRRSRRRRSPKLVEASRCC